VARLAREFSRVVGTLTRRARAFPLVGAAGRHPRVSHFLKRLSQFVGSPGVFLATM